MEIKDLAGISEPLTRLIDVISKGIGAVSQPYLIKKNAKAKADEIKIISSALNEVSTKYQLPIEYKDGEVEVWQKPEDGTLSLNQLEIEDRSVARIDFQERKRQNNIESVTSVAAIELLQEKNVPDEVPDDDWITRFFNTAKDISSDQMQVLWGRILAGEIKKPGTFSLKSLDLIKNLSKSDASLIEHMGKLAVTYMGISLIFSEDQAWLKESRKVYASHQFQMAELGLIYPSELVAKVFPKGTEDKVTIRYGDYCLLIEKGESTKEFNIPIWKFTSIGKELLELVPLAYDEEYLEKLGEFIAKHKCEVVIAKITDTPAGDEIKYKKVKDVTYDS